MERVGRGRQAMQVGALFVIVTIALLSAGCGSKKQAPSPADADAPPSSATGQEGKMPGNAKSMQAPRPPGATGSVADTFVKPGE